MARYPKPDGYNGGPDGCIQRQGTGGRLGAWQSDPGATDNDLRRQELDFEEADLGGSYGGTCYKDEV